MPTFLRIEIILEKLLYSHENFVFSSGRSVRLDLPNTPALIKKTEKHFVYEMLFCF